MTTPRLALLALFTAALCALVVPLVRRLAIAFDVVDHPNERRINKTAIPRLGGVAMFFAFLCVLSAAWVITGKLPAAARVNPTGVWGFAIGAGVIFVAGVIDDIWSLRPRTKLLFEVLAALVVVYMGGCRVTVLSIPGGVLELEWIAIPATVLWIVTVTNAVNFLDGLDGLASGVAAIAFGAIWVTAAPGHGSVAILSAILLGACLGFLVHNFPPATVFMGDSGSLFLGFSLGVLATYAGAKATTGAVTFVPLLILALPLADTIWAMARRYLRGLVPRSIASHLAGVARMFVPDRLHIHHRLLGAGLANREAIYVLYAVQVLACAGAIFIAVVRGLSDPAPPARAETLVAAPSSSAITSR